MGAALDEEALRKWNESPERIGEKAEHFRNRLKLPGEWGGLGGLDPTLKAQLDADATKLSLLTPNSDASVKAQIAKDHVALNKKNAPKQAPDMADALLKASRFGLLGKRTRASSFGGGI